MMKISSVQHARVTVALAVTIVLLLSTLHFTPFTPIISYVVLFIVASGVSWLLAQRILNAAPSEEWLPFTLILLFAFRVSFVANAPIGSDDVFRYMWDGRVQAAGINPYTFAPADAALESLHTETLPSLINHPRIKTVYFPLCQWLFHFAYQLSGEHIWGIKVLLLIGEIVTTVGLVLLLRESSRPLWLVLLYAANPLIILQFSLDAHVDALGFPFLIFAFLFHRKMKKTPSYVLFGLSMLVKPVALVLLPILFLSERGIVNKLKSVLLPLAVLVIPFIPYAANANPVESLATFSRHWYFNGALFSLLLPLVSDNQTARALCLAILVVILLPLYFSKRSFTEQSVLAVLFMLLCSPVAHPWYVGWLMVLLPLAPIASGVALASTASFASFTFIGYQLDGVWKEHPLVLVLEYVPVVVLLALDLFAKSRRRVDYRTPNASTSQRLSEGM